MIRQAIHIFIPYWRLINIGRRVPNSLSTHMLWCPQYFLKENLKVLRRKVCFLAHLNPHLFIFWPGNNLLLLSDTCKEALSLLNILPCQLCPVVLRAFGSSMHLHALDWVCFFVLPMNIFPWSHIALLSSLLTLHHLCLSLFTTISLPPPCHHICSHCVLYQHTLEVQQL